MLIERTGVAAHRPHTGTLFSKNHYEKFSSHNT